jgi:serine/threonine protein kinase
MSPCATPNELEQFLVDGLDRQASEHIAAHLEECTACQQALEQITGAGDTNRRSSSAPTRDERDARLIECLKGAGMRLLDPYRRAEPTADGQERDPVPRGSDRPEDPATARPNATSTIEGFRIIREIGRGGMGVVYEAEDQQLNRRVALKVLAEHPLIHAKQVPRFDREARAAARLHHTHIVPVFGMGRQGRTHYYVMQYIEGIGLDRVIDESRRGREVREAPAVEPSSPVLPDLSGMSTLAATDGRPYHGMARLGLHVAEALHYAHRQGILHRDIKPSNLLLDATGNVWVTDFGLAKTPEADDLTSAGDVLGTIRYMAPERFQGRCDARSDIYSLGLTLYELVALRPVFEASDRYELIEQVRRPEPPRLGRLAPDVSRDLETIIHKAIAPDPDHRYPTAAALADDLRRFLDDRPIQARPVSMPERLVRWCRRNPWAAAFLVALALGLVASIEEAVRATMAERAARQAEVRARNERDLAEAARNRATAAERAARQAEAQARDDRDRAERSRNRALAWVREVILVISERGVEVQSKDEARSHRKLLIEVGLRVVHDLEKDPRAQRETVDAYRVLGMTLFGDGQQAAAVESIRKAVAVAESLFAREHAPENGEALGSVLHFLGSMEPDREAKLSAFRRATAVYERLLAESTKDKRGHWLLLIVGSHIDVATWEYNNGRFREAIAALLEGRALGRDLLEEIGSKSWGCFDLADTEYHLCRAYREVGQFDDAIVAGRRAIAIYQTLALEYPKDIRPATGLELTHQEVARAHLAAGQAAEAIRHFDEARRTLEGLVARSNLLPSWLAQKQLALADLDYTLLAASDSDPARYAELRRAVTSQLVEVCDQMSRIQPPSSHCRGLYAVACLYAALFREQDTGHADLDLLRQTERLLADLHREYPAAVVASGSLVIVRQQLAEELAARGSADEAKHWRLESLSPVRGHPDESFEIALEYARCVLDIGGISHRHDHDRTELQRRRFLRHAVWMLGEAISDGFKDAARLREESVLGPLRPLSEFQALLDDLEFPADPFVRP